MNSTICNPYGAILKIADGQSFDEIAQHIECRPGAEASWTQAIGGACALLASEKLVINRESKERIREQLEKLDKAIAFAASMPNRV